MNKLKVDICRSYYRNGRIKCVRAILVSTSEQEAPYWNGIPFGGSAHGLHSRSVYEVEMKALADLFDFIGWELPDIYLHDVMEAIEEAVRAVRVEEEAHHE